MPTELQQSILELLQKGKTPEQVAKKLNLGERIVNAQITRLRNSGALEDPKAKEVQEEFVPVSHGPATTRPRGQSGTDQIAQDLDKSGTFDVDEVVKRLQAAADKHGLENDVHPMLLLGVTIQFCKFVGGRMHAHQLIEDVYTSLQAMVGDTPYTAQDTKSTQPPMTPEEQVRVLREENFKLQEQLKHLAKNAGPDELDDDEDDEDEDY